MNSAALLCRSGLQPVPVVAVPHRLEYTSDMQAVADNGLMLALFNLGGGEIILVLALVLIWFGADNLSDASRRLGRGLFSFRDAADAEAHEAGRSVGGIFGKGAAQPLTPDNQVAELYDPAALQNEPESRRPLKSLRRFVKNLWHRVSRFLARLRTRTS